MSNQSSFNVDEAKILLQQLRQFDAILKKDWVRVLNKWQNLEPTWRDQQYRQFKPIFDNLSATYKNAGKNCDSYINFIQNKIKEVESI